MKSDKFKATMFYTTLVIALAVTVAVLLFLVDRDQYNRHVEYNNRNRATCESVHGKVIVNDHGWYKSCLVVP